MTRSRAVWPPPEVAEGHDVGMFDAGDHLGLDRKAADEAGAVGQLRVDHLDGNFAPD